MAQECIDEKLADEIEDALDSYLTQFRSILKEINEMQVKMGLFIQQAQIQYDVERNYIVEFALKQKIINVSITTASLLSALLGMNLEFIYGFDNENWTSTSPAPFLVIISCTSAILITVLAAIMRNYKKRSILYSNGDRRKGR